MMYSAYKLNKGRIYYWILLVVYDNFLVFCIFSFLSVFLCILLVDFVFSFLLFGGYSQWAGPLGETQLPLLASF